MAFNTPDRIVALDFAKGILVLFMVLYHGMNYLGNLHTPHQYLKFLPPSFIFITGFIISHIYINRYGAGTTVLRKRLLLRTCKICILFTVLNLCARIVIDNNSSAVFELVVKYLGEWKSIYLLGGSRRAIFEILLPISYMLLLSIPIIELYKSNPRCIYLITAVVVILCAAASRCELFIYNIYMVSAGLLGMAVGIVRRDNIEKVSASNLAILLALGGYWIMNGMLPEAYITQLYAALAVVAAIFAFAIKLNSNRMLFRQVVLLGQYSLFSYIIQILILQVYLRLIAGHIRMEYSSYGIVVITMTAIMVWGAVSILDKMRRQSEKIDTLYRLVFA